MLSFSTPYTKTTLSNNHHLSTAQLGTLWMPGAHHPSLLTSPPIHLGLLPRPIARDIPQSWGRKWHLTYTWTFPKKNKDGIWNYHMSAGKSWNKRNLPQHFWHLHLRVASADPASSPRYVQCSNSMRWIFHEWNDQNPIAQEQLCMRDHTRLK